MPMAAQASVFCKQFEMDIQFNNFALVFSEEATGMGVVRMHCENPATSSMQLHIKVFDEDSPKHEPKTSSKKSSLI